MLGNKYIITIRIKTFTFSDGDGNRGKRDSMVPSLVGVLNWVDNVLNKRKINILLVFFFVVISCLVASVGRCYEVAANEMKQLTL